MRRCLPLLVVAVFATTAPAAEVDKYLLDDTDAILGVDIKLLLQSPLVKKNYLPLAQKQLQSNAEVQKNLKELGIDPFKDIDRILVVHGESCHRSVNSSKEDFAPFVIIRGRFDTAKLHAKVAQLQQFLPTLLKTHKSANGIIYEITADKSFFLALPDRTTIVGSLFKDQVSDALDKAANKKKTNLKTAGMRFMIEQTDNKHAVWVAAKGSAAFSADNPLPAAKDKKVDKTARKKLADSGIDEISGGITVDDGLKAGFRLTVEDEESAKMIAETVQTFLPNIVDAVVGKSDDKRLVPVGEFLRSLSVGRDVRDLVITGNVSGKVFVDSLKP
jgi:hypothetical protein